MHHACGMRYKLSVICHISGGRAELGIGFDNFIDCINEILLCGNLQMAK